MIRPEIKTTTTVSIGEYSLEEFLDLVKDSAHYATIGMSNVELKKLLD